MDMQTGWNENRAMLRGTVTADPVWSHETHGVVYETFPLTVLRLSGSEDTINVIAPRELLEEYPVKAGMPVEVEGEVRSFNNKSGTGSKLVITLHAKSIKPGEGPNENRLTLAGVLCKPPVFRRTPLGRDAGGEPEVRPGGLSALYLLGRPGPLLRRAGGGGRGAAGGPPPEPGLHQAGERPEPPAHRLRGVGDAVGGGGELRKKDTCISLRPAVYSPWRPNK